MKNYKEKSIYVGMSDIAALTAVGCVEEAPFINAEVIVFGEDAAYKAYIVENDDAEIPGHYELCHTFKRWLKIYDDDGLVEEIKGKEIKIYRAGSMGLLIHVIK